MGLRLLIADDEDTIRRGMLKYVQLHSDRFTQLYEAENGQEALDILLKYQPELMILDIQMPLKNGIDVIREAAKAGIHPVTIILSGYDEFAYAQQALRYGAKEYLLKPVRAADILARLNQLADAEFGKEEAEAFSDKENQENRFVKEAQEYIRDHYAENILLSQVADKLGISGGYLSTLFSQNLNCKFIDYLNQVRIERACTYLKQNYLKTYEIAYRVGFKDEKYFSKVFKKLKGVSPKEYRNSEIAQNME